MYINKILDNADLGIINLFIDLYEKLNEKYLEYYTYCEQIQKNPLIKKLDKINEENIESKLEELKKQISQAENIYLKNRLQMQYNTLNNQIKKINVYEKVVNLFDKICYMNIKNEYKDQIEDTEVKIYIKQEDDEKEIYNPKECNIMQIYIKLKRIIEIYKKEKVDDIEKEKFLELIEFYKTYKNSIQNFIFEKYSSTKEILSNVEKEIEKIEEENKENALNIINKKVQ